MEAIREFQGYAYFFMTIFFVVILYGYILHLYRAEKRGTRNYEKYGKLALEDELTDAPVEPNEELTEEKEKKKEQS